MTRPLIYKGTTANNNCHDGIRCGRKPLSTSESRARRADIVIPRPLNYSTNLGIEPISTRRKLVNSPWLGWCLASNLYLSFVAHLTSDVLDGQIFLFHESKYFYRGLMDLGTIIIIYFLVIRFGSRGVQASLFLLPAFLMVIAIAFQQSLPILTEYDWFDFRLLLVPSTCFRVSEALVKIAVIFIWFHSMKSLATEIRASGFLLIYSAGIVGKLAAPNLSILGETIENAIPVGFCGLLCLIAAGLSFSLPPKCEPISLVIDPIRHGHIISEPIPVTLSQPGLSAKLSNQSLTSFLVNSSPPSPSPSPSSSGSASVSVTAAETEAEINGCKKPNRGQFSSSKINIEDTALSGADVGPSMTTLHFHQHQPNFSQRQTIAEPVTTSRPCTMYNADIESNLSNFDDLFGFDNWQFSPGTTFTPTNGSWIKHNTLS